jgi:uncharacterized protein (UPF0332 family)
MELTELEDCIKKGLISKVPKSVEGAEKSMARADMWLVEAKMALEAGIYDSCILTSYEAMFHAARALLIRDGYRERSHYCVVRYLNESYAKKGLLNIRTVTLIDNYRELRHDAAYSLEFKAVATDAKEAVKDAGLIVKEIKTLLKLS